MDDTTKPNFPFITRKDLSFEHGTTFDLEVVSYAIVTGAVQLIGVTKEGPFVFAFSNPGTSARTSNIFPIPDIPIFLTLHGNVTTMRRGEFYGIVYLRMNGTRVLRLCGGYVARDHGISYPLTENRDETEGKGFQTTITSSNPAAGSELLATVPLNTIWKVKALRFTLVTDGTVASRLVHLNIYGGGALTNFNTWAGTAQTASQTITYHSFPLGAASTSVGGTEIFIPLPPDLLLGEGDQIATLTDNLVAGDNFGSMDIWVEQLFEDL